MSLAESIPREGVTCHQHANTLPSVPRSVCPHGDTLPQHQGVPACPSSIPAPQDQCQLLADSGATLGDTMQGRAERW